MAVRAKFRVQSYSTSLHWNDKAKELRTIRFSPVMDGSPENKEFYEASPAGQIELGTLNKKAWEQFELGKSYYVDFSEAPD